MNRSNIVMTMVMLSIFVLMVGLATQFPPQARFMPLVVGIPGIALCLLQLILDARSRQGGRSDGSKDARNQFEQAQEKVSRMTGQALQFDMAHEQLKVAVGELPQEGERRRELALWGSFIALVASIILFGFWPTMPVFLLLFLRFLAEKTWAFSAGLAAVGTGLLFLVFQKGLGVVLFGGYLTGLVLERLAGS